jgi:hypothetical protein
MDMKTIQVAAMLSLAVGSMAFGQQAVQWKVSDGGNGHWYARVPELVTWPDAKVRSEQLGGHLATLTSAGENSFAGALNLPGPSPNSWIGGFQDRNAPDFSEPAGGWRWVTGEAWQFTAWDQSGPAGGEPNNLGPYNEDYLCTWVGGNTWNDLAGGLNPGAKGYPFICEWSADCNGDGIVDYGQCRDGSLPDYNGNNIPDCCEQGTPCMVGSYPVQWRVSEGGNWHWYRLVVLGTDISWADASDRAHQAGGYLASVTSSAENGWLHALVVRNPSAFATHGPWLGGRLLDNQWRWESGEPWGFTAWTSENPSGDGASMGYWEITNPASASWNDAPESNAMVSFVIEWSADCNNDGIVDQGQILRGQLADFDSDGIPDVCECATSPGLPACCVGNLNGDPAVDGADLGILLNAWGTCAAPCAADLNRDGFVDGADLGILLGNWGACP